MIFKIMINSLIFLVFLIFILENMLIWSVDFDIDNGFMFIYYCCIFFNLE